jgi:hypothetical protein
MAPVNTRDVIRLLAVVVLTAALYRFWLTTPVLEHLTQNQWRVVAIGAAGVLGILWSLAKCNLSTLIAGFMSGLLVGGTLAILPIAHGRVGNAFKGNLESLGFEMIAFTVAATLGWYCVSRLTNNYRDVFRGKDPHPKGG